ncbi:hypothetical protein B566_EDAN001976 [Ephemera danica]|nr:hypothetical protein B566_EDAN001976 [Ephemera danica]
MHTTTLVQICVVLLAVAGLTRGQGTRMVDQRCSASGFRCISRRDYTTCTQSKPQKYFRCDPGKVCSNREPSGQMCIQEAPPCVENGRVGMPGDCRRFSICMPISDNRIQQLEGLCNPGYRYNKPTLGCDPDPTCGVTNGSRTTVSASNDFVCTREGAFPDPSSCRSFLRCRQDQQGVLQVVKGRCPPVAPFFHGTNNVCVSSSETCMARPM